MKKCSTPEVAHDLGVSVRTLYRWLASGAIPEPSRLGGKGTARRWGKRDIARALKIVRSMEIENERYGTLVRLVRQWSGGSGFFKSRRDWDSLLSSSEL